MTHRFYIFYNTLPVYQDAETGMIRINSATETDKVRTIAARLIYVRTTQVISLNVVYLLMFNNDSTTHVSERESVCSKQWKGRTLVQVNGSRVSLSCNVLVCLKHTCEYKCVLVKEHAYYNRDKDTQTEFMNLALPTERFTVLDKVNLHMVIWY